MAVRVKTCCLTGIEGNIIDVEADVSTGLPSFDIVGLPDAIVKEAKERVRASIKNCGFDFPSKKIVINLAPANIRKEGSLFDLPIAMAVLAATGQIKEELLGSYIFLGELSLSGELRPVCGVLPNVINAAEKGFEKVVLPQSNALEASIVSKMEVYGAKNLTEVILHLAGDAPLKKYESDMDKLFSQKPEYDIDFSEVKGQENVKRAALIAAAGGHNLLIIGSPGSGKTMIARRIPTILPDMSPEEALEVTKIYSAAGLLRDDSPLITLRPFRSPHHSTSTMGLVGGGQIPKPGELSLAHNGVLFLDEFPEFKKEALEVMRQPLEDGFVTIARVSATLTYPCRTMLVAAMNPCKCGYYGDPSGKCRCSESSVQKYLSRVSGPLLDRIDIQIEATSVRFSEFEGRPAQTSAEIRDKVNRARRFQLKRYKGTNIHSNAQLSGGLLAKYCRLAEAETKLMREAFISMHLSARAYTKILKVARTIADLEEREEISVLDIAEALQYRSLDRKFWR